MRIGVLDQNFNRFPGLKIYGGLLLYSSLTEKAPGVSYDSMS